MISARVLVMGATGAVGSELVRQCIKDDRIEYVVAFTRRPLQESHSKLKVIVRDDFLNYDDLTEELSEIDICYCALGVSQVQVRDPKLYTAITRDYVLAAARALKSANPDIRFCFVSGAGADASEKSGTLWRRVKGETENRLRELLGDPKRVKGRDRWRVPILGDPDSSASTWQRPKVGPDPEDRF